MTTIIKLRRDTAANWTSANPILAAGEPGLETDTLRIKYGDGTNTWANLSYQAVGNATYAASAGTANIALSVNVANVANIGNIATINLDGNISNVLFGNGTFGPVTGANTGNISFNDTTISADSITIESTDADIILLTDSDVLVELPDNKTFTINTASSNSFVFNSGDPNTAANLTFPDNTVQETAWTGTVNVANVANIGNIANINLDGNVGNVLSGNGTWIAAGGTIDGNINIPSTNSEINFVANSSGDGSGYSTIQLVPDSSLGSDQYIILDPTAPSHIHIRAGGTQDNSGADLFLGGEKNHVRVSDNDGVYLVNITTDSNFYNFVDPTQFTNASWYMSNGSPYITFTTSDPTLQQVALDFNGNAQNSVEADDGGNLFNLTQSGYYGNEGGGVYVLGVNEAPAGNVTINLTGLNFTLYTTRYNEARVTSNDFTVDVTDDVRITGSDIVTLRNRSVSEPVTITTDYDGNSKNWEFTVDGKFAPPQLNTARGDTLSGSLFGYTLRLGYGDNEAVITTPDGSNLYNSSQRLVINPGKGADGTTGEGGDIYLWAGRGGDYGGSGGDIKIRGGYGSNTGDGGYIRMEGGQASSTGTAGYVEIHGGETNGGIAGYVDIKGGYNGNGIGGNISISSGNGTSAYGNVTINTTSGNTWTFDNAGNLTTPTNLTIGTAPIPGTAIFQAANTSLSIVAQDSNGFMTVGWAENPNTPSNLATINFNYSPGMIQFVTGNANGTSYNLTFDNTGNFSVPGNILVSGNASPAPYINGFSSITLSGTGTAVNASAGNILTNEVTGTKFNFLNGLYTAKLTGSGVAANYSLNLPANAGSNGQVLSTDGTGNLSWIAAGGGSYGDSNVVTLLGSFGSNTISTTGNISGANILASANVLSNGYARFSGTFDESAASTAGLYLGYAGNTSRIMFGTGNTSQTFEIDNDAGNLRFYMPGSTKATLTSTGNLSILGNITANNLGNIVSVNLDSNVSNVLTGNGTFTALPVINANTVVWTTAPVANNSAGTAGQAAYDTGGNLYVCVTTNTWAKFTGTTSW